ncbi:MAG: hypothetical protein A2381_15885 [Bdellovibrionales bacterium RIFOXYB1_FULL_37_110]|nr:MAG: hypothetical protein A2417_07735 [Bdellovibrionales bacterium RIFOXYC1_FULL_37_79]OFZ57094.1 MAG: hypothetical protein A2381_15885 [Bdellovibrionales bacterium RIFOXYB1_FULL_37_110]OFZ62055.1 MAG: hypothetical protein A2577_08345 [Bdellovibrionales bacterium RIFOXYD1_FULL_36_51]
MIILLLVLLLVNSNLGLADNPPSQNHDILYFNTIDNEPNEIPAYAPYDNRQVMAYSKFMQVFLPLVLVGILLNHPEMENSLEKILRIYKVNIPTALNKSDKMQYLLHWLGRYQAEVRYNLMPELVDLFKKIHPNYQYPALEPIRLNASQLDEVAYKFVKKWVTATSDDLLQKTTKAYATVIKELAGHGLFFMGANMAYMSLTGMPLAYAANAHSIMAFVSFNYLGFKIIGDKLIRKHLFPLMDTLFPPHHIPATPTIDFVRKYLPKWFGEFLSTTHYHMPLKEIIYKMVEIASVASISWMAPDMAFLYSHTGQFFHWEVVTHFDYSKFLTLAYSSYFGFIWGKNSSEMLLNGGSHLSRLLEKNSLRFATKFKTNTGCLDDIHSLLNVSSQSSLSNFSLKPITSVFNYLKNKNNLLSFQNSLGLLVGSLAVGFLAPRLDHGVEQILRDRKIDYFRQVGEMNPAQIAQVSNQINDQLSGTNEIDWVQMDTLFNKWDLMQTGSLENDQSNNQYTDLIIGLEAFRISLESNAQEDSDDTKKLDDLSQTYKNLQQIGETASQDGVRLTDFPNFDLLLRGMEEAEVIDAN